MRRSSLIMCALLLTASSGCEQVKEQTESLRQQITMARERFFGKKKAAAVSEPAPKATPAPTPPPAPAPAKPAAQAPAAPAKRPIQQLAGNPTPPAGGRDEPYVSQDTGTVFPGMSEKDVYSLWGSPSAVRHMGEFTYIYFKNGCEYSCGHLDVVTLKNGQVVDALVRWPGHGYAGQSTSPESETPHGPPPGGDTLQVKPPPSVNEGKGSPADTVPAAPPQAP